MTSSLFSQIFTFNESHIFDPTTVNEFRFGFNRIHFDGLAGAELNPFPLGIRVGIDRPGGSPQLQLPIADLFLRLSNWQSKIGNRQ